MAESQQGGEKTEEPTPKRLTEARGEGQVAFSPDLNSAALLLSGFILLAATGTWFAQSCARGMRSLLASAIGLDLNDRELWHAIAVTCLPVALWGLAVCAALFAAGTLISVAQVGLHLSPKALLPKVAKVNPLTGFGRLFGLRGLVRFATNVGKVVLILIMAWKVITADLDRLIAIDPDPGHRLATESWMLFILAIKLVLVMVVIAVADWLYQGFQHRRDLMMTKQEVKEEFKQSEGDPLVKGKIRQIQRQMAQRRMMQEVPKADVVITNPTHVAVALKYDQGKMAAPVVLAKGYDGVAQRIKAIAQEHGIPLVENVALARALAKEVAVGKPVSVKWYQPVAEVLAMVYKLRKGAG